MEANRSGIDVPMATSEIAVKDGGNPRTHPSSPDRSAMIIVDPAMPSNDRKNVTQPPACVRQEEERKDGRNPPSKLKRKETKRKEKKSGMQTVESAGVATGVWHLWCLALVFDTGVWHWCVALVCGIGVWH